MRINTMLKDYARCIYFESQGNPARALRVARGLIRARLKHDIGPLHYSLFRFADTPKKEWSNYIRERSFGRVLETVNSDNKREFLKNKALFYQHCLDHGLPTPAVICMIGRSTSPFPSGIITCIADLDQWKDAIGSAPRELFVKPVSGGHGDGAFTIRRLGRQFIFGQPETEGSAEDLYRYVLDRLKEDVALLVQPRVKTHHKILEISSPSGLATARIVTALVNNTAKVLYACAKLPVGTNVTDNFAKGAVGNLVAAIDIDTGALSEGLGSARSDWPVMRSIDFHPDTGNQIRGAILPLWSEAVDLVGKAQNSLPKIKTIGWDLAITDDGVMLIEGNETYAVEILEVAYQRGLGSELISVIEGQANPSSPPKRKRR